MSNNIPEIRFKGFTHAWEQRTLGEVAEKLKSYSLSRDVETIKPTGYRYIHYGDIHKRVADLITSSTKLPYIKYGNYIPLSQGDLVLADASEDYTGIAEPCVIIDESIDKIVAGLHTIALRPRNAASLYLYYLLHTDNFKKFGNQMGTGLKVFGITFDNLSLFKTNMPSVPEQTAIGNFFRTLDDAITLHKRKLEGLKELKSAYLQQMFPQAGENLPRVRFAGFTGDWKKRKLGEMVEKLKSYSLSRDVETKEETGYRYIHYGDIHKQVADLIVTDKQLPCIKISDYIPLNRGDLVLADASEDYTGIAEPSIILHEPHEKIIAGLHTIALRPQNTNALYLYYLLHTDTFKKYGCKAGTGLKVFGITFDNLSIFETTIPIIEEQIAIGYFFYNFDCIIEKQKIKLDKLKQLKSAYLQKLFV